MTKYGWSCQWCGTSHMGEYSDSIEKERIHRASCRAAPRELRQPVKWKNPLAPEKHYVGCNAGYHCSRSHYWMSPAYVGEVCCEPFPCHWLKEAAK